MHNIIIPLTNNQFTFNTDCIWKLMYNIVIHIYQCRRILLSKLSFSRWINCQSTGWFCSKLCMMNNTFVAHFIFILLYLIYNEKNGSDVNYFKHTNNIPTQLFRYLLFYMKLDMINNYFLQDPFLCSDCDYGTRSHLVWIGCTFELIL